MRKGTGQIFLEESENVRSMYEQVKDENKKLQKTEDVIYMIWNLPCYITCPYATEACKVACYAEFPENDKARSKQVVPYRMANLAMCTGDNEDTFVQNMITTIEKKLASKKYKSRKTIRVRIHESGDFFSKKYAMAWLEIAKHFVGVENLVFMAYTKSFPFFDGVALPENFVLRASIWQDTPDEMLEIVRRNGWPTYMAVPESMTDEMVENGFTKCDCENCSTCEKHCFTRENKNMFVLLHGKEAKKLHKDVPRLKAIAKMF